MTASSFPLLILAALASLCAGTSRAAQTDAELYDLAVARCIQAGRATTTDGDLQTCARITAAKIKADLESEVRERELHGVTARELGSLEARGYCYQSGLRTSELQTCVKEWEPYYTMQRRLKWIEQGTRPVVSEPNVPTGSGARVPWVRSGPNRTTPSAAAPTQPGTPVYPAADCIGAVVMGICHGTVIQREAVPKRCYGEMIDGRCTGPMF